MAMMGASWVQHAHQAHQLVALKAARRFVQSDRMQTACTIYPLTNYSFGSKEKRPEKDAHVEQRMARLKAAYERDGVMRRSVEGIILVQEHNHPHVLMLQLAASFFKLPGGRLRPGEDEAEGLKRKLTNALSPTSTNLQTQWDVGECAGVFWRPNFDTQFYPYLPVHITRPKECKKLYIVPLADKALFAVPRNMRLVAVPLYELYDNMSRHQVLSGRCTSDAHTWTDWNGNSCIDELFQKIKGSTHWTALPPVP